MGAQAVEDVVDGVDDEREARDARGEFLRPDSEIAQAVNMHHHTQLWKSLDAKAPAKGLGVSIAGAWYWYQPWLDIVRAYCEENTARFR